MRLGRRIRSLRKAQGLTQEDLGEKANLHYTYIGAVERGECNISLKNIEKIATALDITLSELFSFPSGYQAATKEETLISEIVGMLKNKHPKTIGLIREVARDIIEGM